MKANRNIIFNKVGGNASKNSVNYKVSLPAEMVKELGVTPDNKGVVLTCENGKIIIEKSPSS